MEVVVEGFVRRLGIFASYVWCDGVRVEVGRPDVRVFLDSAVRSISSTYSIEGLKEHPVVRAYRNVMWRLGIDPTKVRPSSEALVRRVLRRGSIPSINSLVDICNVASMETLIPISVFDMGSVKPPLTLRRAVTNEEFVDLSGKSRRLSGREVVLADSSGRVLHLYPHKDSIHASINEGTSKVLVVSYGAPGVPKALVSGAAARTSTYIARFYPAARCSSVEVSA